MRAPGPRRCTVALAALFLAAGALVGDAHLAFANGPEVGFDAGTIYPLNSKAIQLVSEDVEIRPDLQGFAADPRTKNATCVYRLRNLTDKAQTFAMAFVTNDPISPTESESWGSMYREADFEVDQDGHPRDVRFEAGSHEFRSEYGAEAASFPTWTLTIGPRATSRVTTRFVAMWTGGSDGTSSGNSFTYHARPAARWAGKIERASFRLILDDTAAVRRFQRKGAYWTVSVSPEGYRWVRDGLRWEFRDWEPGADLRLRIGYPASNDVIEPAWSPFSPDSLALMPGLTGGLQSPPVAESVPECPDPRITSGSRPLAGWPADSVRVRVHVTELGTVAAIRYPEPHGMLGFAKSCVRTWRFRPAIKAGRITSAWIDVVVRLPEHHD